MRGQADRCPVSVKGVLIEDGRVLLLLNARGQWDLPGGRPEPGESHRAALAREVREETGLSVEVGRALEAAPFEVLPGRWVRIVPFVCRLRSTGDVALSPEHLAARWLALDALADPLADPVADPVAGHPLPACYRAAIRQATDQPPLSSTERSV
jgi:8-oxo-dGTP pyrophosphatase MutT (NUDIX family)